MGFPHRLVYVSAVSGNMPYLIGPTGSGKSMGVESILLNWMGLDPAKIVIVRAAQQDPITMGSGVPFRNEDGLTFSAVVEKHLFEVGTDALGAIFFDELPDCDVDQMNAVAPIINERLIGEHRLEAAMFGAGNRPVDGSNELNKKLASRMQSIEVKRDRAMFVKGLREGWDNVMGAAPRIPGNWIDLIDGKKKHCADFVDQHPEALPDEDEHIDPSFPAHPNERTWEVFACRFLACAEAAHLSRKETQTGLEGCVGRGLGAQFMMWSRHGGLDVKALINDTTKLKEYVNAAPDTVDMIFDAVGAYVGEKQITGEECGAFYAAGLKYGFSTELLMRHLRRIADKLPKAVRESIFNEIAVRSSSNS